MTKKLLPTMIGVALAAGVTSASADVTVFGHIDTAVSNIDDETSGKDDTNFTCTTCSIGFKGSEDLGNGLKAIFSLDFQYDTTERNNGIRGSVSTDSDDFVTRVTTGSRFITTSTGTKGTFGYNAVTKVNTFTQHAVTKVRHSNSGSDALFDRDQWLGLAGNFGKVRIGTISTHYKSHGAKLDPLYRTALQGRDHGLQSKYHRGAGEELQGRATNTLRYDSPNWNGLDVGFHYTLDSDEGNGEDDNPFGIGGSYTNGGIFVFADWMTNDGGEDNPSGDLTVWKLGGKYSLNNFAVMAQYESEDEDNSGDEIEYWHVGGSYTMGNNMVYAAYGETSLDDGAGSASDEDWDAWTIAGVHSMSKRTSVYLGYNSQDRDERGDIDEFSVGMKHKF